ncbi:DUF6390 family protein [Mycolicibacterium sp. XJ1819]
MTVTPVQRLPAGHAMFARYAYPPNELGYCGPADASVLLRGDNPGEVAAHAREFDGTWPYLSALATAAGVTDPLDADVVRNYWVGGALLADVDPATLLHTLRRAFTGQVTGALADLAPAAGVLAHHSFHVFAVYPWVRFLDRDATTAMGVLHQCRIRWGTVESVAGDHAALISAPLRFTGGALALADPVVEHVRWRRDGVALVADPRPGDLVAAHWDWLCDRLTDTETEALATATQATLDLINAARKETRLRQPRTTPHPPDPQEIS